MAFGPPILDAINKFMEEQNVWYHMRFAVSGIVVLVAVVFMSGLCLAQVPMEINTPTGKVKIDSSGKVKVKTDKGETEIRGGKVKGKRGETEITPGKVKVKKNTGNEVEVNSGDVKVKTKKGKTVKVSSSRVSPGKAHYSCKGDERLVIKGEVLNVGGGVALRAKDSCEIVVKDTVVNSKVAIEVVDKGEITFKDGTLNCSGACIRAFDSGRVNIEAAAINASTGAEASDRSKVGAEDCTLNATTAIVAKDKAKVLFEDSMVTGKRIVKDKADVRVDN